MTLDASSRATIRFAIGTYAAMILLQRFAVPGLPVSLLVPLIYAVSLWGLLKGVLEIHPQRAVAWLAMVTVTGLVLVFQVAVLRRELVSVSSWALFMAAWAPFILRLADRRTANYLEFLRKIVTVSVVLAWACVLMMVTQFLGLAYRDWLADVVPGPFLLNGFVISYPVEYGSAIYRANAWIGLEPSTVSAQLGIGLIAAILVGSRTRTVVLLLVGLIATTSGSGFALVAVAFVVVVLSTARRQLRRHAPAAVAALLVGALSPMGATIWQRLTTSGLDPSFSLRAIAPYPYLWPTWSDGLSPALWGLGPGSSQQLITRSGIDGLLVTTPIKVFFDYGLLAGAVMAAFMLFAAVDGPSRSIAATIVFSMWTLQPGSTAPVVVLPLLLTVSWWAPRYGDVLERRYRLVRSAYVPPPRGVVDAGAAPATGSA